MVADLEHLNLGYEPVKEKTYDWAKLGRRKANDIGKFWLAVQVSNQLGDISKIERLDYADLWTYSFCCQDISVAGKQQGMIKGETRSGLLYEVQRLLAVAEKDGVLPKYLLLENVKNLVGKQFKGQFDEWLDWLDKLGYNTYWQVVNAKNCGVPQNRERCFALSIRKDIDTGLFQFPQPFDNGMRLKDVLEERVADKYYITTEKADNLINQLIESGDLDNPNAERERESNGIDFSVNCPHTTDTANCVSARQDRGISNRRQEGTGVIEQTVPTSD